MRAFNEDLPYDQFLMQQIAADKLPLGEDKRPLAALGFLTLGNRFNNQQNDVIDDRIGIIGKGTLGLTLQCARCHDHKFDPILTTDYYALHGVFNSTVEPKEEPLIEPPADTAAYRSFRDEYATRKGTLDTFRAEVSGKLKAEMIGKSADYMLAIFEFHHTSNELSRGAFVQKRGLNPQLAGIWDNNLKNWEKKRNPVFTPWFAFGSLPDADFATGARDLAAKVYANDEKGSGSTR